MRLVRSVERTQQCAALHPGAFLSRVDTHRPHRCEIDRQPVPRDPEAEHAVSAAAHADLDVEIPGRQNGCPHVRDITAACDQTRPPIDHRVPYRARRVVGWISGYDDVAVEGLREPFCDHAHFDG